MNFKRHSQFQPDFSKKKNRKFYLFMHLIKYRALFSWINFHVNVHFCRGQKATKNATLYSTKKRKEKRKNSNFPSQYLYNLINFKKGPTEHWILKLNCNLDDTAQITLSIPTCDTALLALPACLPNFLARFLDCDRQTANSHPTLMIFLAGAQIWGQPAQSTEDGPAHKSL